MSPEGKLEFFYTVSWEIVTFTNFFFFIVSTEGKNHKSSPATTVDILDEIFKLDPEYPLVRSEWLKLRLQLW